MSSEVDVAGFKIVSADPATGARLGEIDCASDEDLHNAVSRARAAQPDWNVLGVRARISILKTFQELLCLNKSEIARAISREAGKPVVEALLTEVLVVLDSVQFCREHAQAFLRDEPVEHGAVAMKAKSARIVREPHGVIGIISPWNYPFSIPATETLAALVTGNAVVLKPSEFTPLVARQLAELLHRAGVPEAVFQVVVGDGNTGAALTKSAIDKVIFTGSVSTGKRIAQAAAARLLPVVLELGGKDPMLVLEDADIDAASSGAVWGAFLNAGQTCLSVERCYVHHRIYERFVEACVRKTTQLRVGNGAEVEVDIGPMIHERQLRSVEMQIEDALKKGARVLAGGSRLIDLGANFYAPTVLADVNHSMDVMLEETFGPVLPIMPFETDLQALRLANDSPYGLAASVWTLDPARGEAMARGILAGTVMINDAISCYGISEAPHGGVKASGLGRTHGRFGLEEMVRIKYLSSDALPRMKKVWWYGYGQQFSQQMEGFIDVQFAPSRWRRMRGLLRLSGLWRHRKL